VEGKTRGRELECDCGYVAHGEGDDELVAAVQAHARHAHGMKLSAELVLTLVGSNGGPFHRVAPDGVHGEPVASLETERLRR
jgi:hypothetical protein